MELITPVKLDTQPKVEDFNPVAIDTTHDGTRIYGLDVIEPSIKEFKCTTDSVLIAAMQESSVLTLANKFNPEAKDLRFITYMVVAVGPLAKDIKPGDIPFIRSSDNGQAMFGNGSFVPFIENRFNGNVVANYYRYKPDGTPYKDHEMRDSLNGFQGRNRERIISYYCIPSHFIQGVMPEHYKLAFNVPLTHIALQSNEERSQAANAD